MAAIAELPWLPPVPADFAQRCERLARGEADGGLEAQFLACHGLDARQARRLSRAIARARLSQSLAPLAPLTMVVLSNATFDFIADHLPAAAARHGVSLEVVVPPFDQVIQEVMDPASITHRAKPDVVLLALDHRWYGFENAHLDDPEAAAAAAKDRLTAVMEALTALADTTIVVSTVPAPPDPLFGNLDRRVAGAPRGLVEAINRDIVEMAGARGALMLDTAALAAQVGLDAWFDPVAHLAYKLPFNALFDGLYADTVARLLGALRGKARKCLVLDLDNTLWGGVVGDDGVEGLVLGPGSARGESYLAIQKYARDLARRGVMLAVSSKNDDAVARAAFAEHPEMVLRLADISAFQANWLDKPTNLEAVAQTLNIGLDALVLLDDNPAERAQVRAALPLVAVPELPADPGAFPRLLSWAGYFEAVAFSREDRLRAQSYAGDARRAEVSARTRDLGDYLASLDMRLEVGPFDATGRARIAQLINKTNQFNLTTRRYTEAQVAAFETAASTITIQARLSDSFGDLGMISVVIARICDAGGGSREAVVDTWLMSCRVLGRKVEDAMLDILADRAAAAGAERIRAEFRPTAKNAMVRDLLDRLGFELVGEDADGVRRYVRAVARPRPSPLPHQVTRSPAWTHKSVSP